MYDCTGVWTHSGMDGLGGTPIRLHWIAILADSRSCWLWEWVGSPILNSLKDIYGEIRHRNRIIFNLKLKKLISELSGDYSLEVPENLTGSSNGVQGIAEISNWDKKEIEGVGPKGLAENSKMLGANEQKSGSQERE